MLIITIPRAVLLVLKCRYICHCFFHDLGHIIQIHHKMTSMRLVNPEISHQNYTIPTYLTWHFAKFASVFVLNAPQRIFACRLVESFSFLLSTLYLLCKLDLTVSKQPSNISMLFIWFCMLSSVTRSNSCRIGNWLWMVGCFFFHFFLLMDKYI